MDKKQFKSRENCVLRSFSEAEIQFKEGSIMIAKIVRLGGKNIGVFVVSSEDLAKVGYKKGDREVGIGIQSKEMMEEIRGIRTSIK